MTAQHIPPIERLQVRLAEAAQLLSISERHLRRLISNGDIRSVGRGRLRRVALIELRRWQVENEGEHQTNQGKERLVLGSSWRDPFMTRGGLVFTTETGGPLFGGLVVRPFKAALKRIGLPAATRFHDLRHTAATLMLTDGVPLVTVAKVLGHSSPAITAQIYAHALDESKSSAIAGLSAKLKRSP